MTHRVTVPYLMLKVRTDRGVQMHPFHAGAVVPASADADDLARLVRKGAVEEVAVEEAEVTVPEPAEPKAEEPPKKVAKAADKSGS